MPISFLTLGLLAFLLRLGLEFFMAFMGAFMGAFIDFIGTPTAFFVDFLGSLSAPLRVGASDESTFTDAFAMETGRSETESRRAGRCSQSYSHKIVSAKY